MRILHKPDPKVPVMNSDFWHDNNFIINMAAAQKYNNHIFDKNLPKRYLADERILSSQIPKLIKKNSSRDEIYHAITLINSFYSTRMGADDCWRLSEILYKKHSEIWYAILATDIAKIDVVQSVIDAQSNARATDTRRRVAFSFTTKYFSILNRYIGKGDVYPIYDTLVAKMLDYYFWRLAPESYCKSYVSSCNTSAVKDYKRFYSVITTGLGWGKDYKVLDNYLWDFGRRLSENLPRRAWATLNPDEIANAINLVIK